MIFEKPCTFYPIMLSPLNVKLLDGLYGFFLWRDLSPTVEGNTVRHLKPLTVPEFCESQLMHLPIGCYCSCLF